MGYNVPIPESNSNDDTYKNRKKLFVIGSKKEKIFLSQTALNDRISNTGVINFYGQFSTYGGCLYKVYI